MSRVISHEVLSGLFDASAEEIQNCMSGDYGAEDLLIAAQVKSLQQAAKDAERRSHSRGKQLSSEYNPVTEKIVEGDEEGGRDDDDDIAPVELPDMWSRNFIGLYSQYAAVGKYFICRSSTCLTILFQVYCMAWWEPSFLSVTMFMMDLQMSVQMRKTSSSLHGVLSCFMRSSPTPSVHLVCEESPG